MTKVLLDTIAFYFLMGDITQIPSAARAILSDAENLAKYDIELLDLSIEDTHEQAMMPFLTIHGNVHKDPFDRLIVAQAKRRNLLLLSSDRKLPLYPIAVVWE